MSVFDSIGVFALIGLAMLRLGVPLVGIWLLSTALKRMFPTQV